MLKGLSLSALAAKIESNQASKADYIAPTAKTTMQIVGPEAKTPVLEFESPAGQQSMPILQLAHEQIASRLNIPKAYYDRMRADAPDLLATNVNAWFRKNPETRMVRTMGGNVRAFLSNRYNRIENEEIAGVVLPILAEIEGIKIVSAEITERRMYIQAVNQKAEGTVKVGDVVQAGVIISNSEVGHGSVGIAPFAYRLICLNGMIMPDGKLRANHVGGRIDDMDALYADDTRRADDRAILLKVRDHVKLALDQVAFATRVNRMSGLTTLRGEDGKPEEMVQALAKKVGFNDGETSGLLRSLIEGGDLSAWGMLNAVTAQAHTAKDYDRSVEIEAMGGQLLELPRTAWKEILEAA